MNEFESESALKITQQSSSYLEEIRKWTLFFSILGFVFLGILMIVAFFAGSIMNEMSPNSEFTVDTFEGAYITTIYLATGLLYFFPIYYLYQFSANMKSAISLKNEDHLEKAFKNLKSHYKFMGILTVIILAFYVLIGGGMSLIGLI
jgi:magnesium-transporting ATPase (P-type)